MSGSGVNRHGRECGSRCECVTIDSRVQVWVLVVEADDHANEHEIGLHVIQEAASKGLVEDASLQRPSQSVLHESTNMC